MNDLSFAVRFEKRTAAEICDALDISKRNAKLAKYRSIAVSSKENVLKPASSDFVLDKQPEIPIEPTENDKSVSGMPLEPCLIAFEESFNNPLSSRSHSASSTKAAVVANARSIVQACGYTDVSELYSSAGLKVLQNHFSYLSEVKMLKERSKKNLLAGYIEFLNFLEFMDDLPYTVSKRMKFITYLGNAYSAFTKGCKFDEKERAIKLGEEMHKGLFPLFTEVDNVYQHLKDDNSTLMEEMSSMGTASFRTFVSFVSFGLLRRCVIRPGALLLMTISEFQNPNQVDEDTFLVHVREQKAATYNDGFVNIPSLIYDALLFYIDNWRPKMISASERLVIKPNGSSLSSGELGMICKRAFNEFYPSKEFTFSRFRMHCQTVFSNACTDPIQMKWFNQMMCHRYNNDVNETALINNFSSVTPLVRSFMSWRKLQVPTRKWVISWKMTWLRLSNAFLEISCQLE